MGFCEAEARKALAECVWDVNRALDLLVSRGAVALAPLPKGEVRGASARGSNDSSEIASIKSRDFDNSTTASSVSTPRFQSSVSNLATETGQVADTTLESKEASQKPIRRVSSHVAGQDDGLLAAEADDFVRVWPHSETELGWIYAEDPVDASRAGWLPSLVLEQVEEPGHAWLLVKKSMPAVHANQLDVEASEILKVNLSSRTPEGWAYAEKVTPSKTNAAGWVPVVSLCWDDSQE
eukprot:Skav209616  [mRNA]  locus=scaffold1634:607491:608494:- [translate_table: standard]